MKRTRRHHGAAFKAQVALAACTGDKTLAELAAHFGVQPTQITDSNRHVLERVADVFGGTTHKPDAPDLTVPHASESRSFARKYHHLLHSALAHPSPHS